MAVTATVLNESENSGSGKQIIFNVPLGAAWTGAGETLDLTEWFTRVYYAHIQTVVVADGIAIELNLELPEPTVDITATNILVTAKRDRGVDSGAGGFDNCNAEDLSGVVLTRLLVVGRPVAGGTW